MPKSVCIVGTLSQELDAKSRGCYRDHARPVAEMLANDRLWLQWHCYCAYFRPFRLRYNGLRESVSLGTIAGTSTLREEAEIAIVGLM